MRPFTSDDERLAHILSDVTDSIRRGESPDLQALLQQHPDLAAELKEVWPALVLAEELGSPALDHEKQTDSAAPQPDASAPVGLGGSAHTTHQVSLPRTFGDYELVEELGRGGMGVVYKARQKSLNRLVALKMILRGEFASAADLVRFRAEAESAARLEHPNIVPVYDVGECDGQAFFTMKYVEGTTLAGMLSRPQSDSSFNARWMPRALNDKSPDPPKHGTPPTPLPPRDAARYLAAVCRAIDFAHQHGILHRDLKPSNILIDRDDRPLVTDFGLAKRVASFPLSLGGRGVRGEPSLKPAPFSAHPAIWPRNRRRAAGATSAPPRMSIVWARSFMSYSRAGRPFKPLRQSIPSCFFSNRSRSRLAS
jgi:serine/threonine-protein kinase